MIAHARIVSAKDATIQFADRSERIEGESRNEVRTAIKHAFVAEARKQDAPVDVVIFDGPATHSLRVEPNGRIQPREADSRPLYASSAAMPAASGQKRGRHSALSATSPTTGSHSRQASATSPDSANAASAAALADLQKRLAAADERPAADSTSSPEPLEAKHHAEGDALNPGARAPAASPTKPHEPVVAPKRELPKDDDLPTLDDLRKGNDAHRKPVATRGLNKFVRQATFGLLKPGPGRAERRELDQIERIRKRLDAPKNIAVVNLKGGAHKTTSVLMLAATLGMFRGGSVLAWDNNETRGTLGWRGIPSEHHLTALDLLHNLDHFAGSEARVADLDKYVRPQGDMNFDILASDEDPGSAASIDGDAFNRLNDTLSRFYRIKVVDTGNNVRASNWLAAVEGADQLVIVSTVREDTFNAAAWMIDELRMTSHKKQVENAVTILSHSSRGQIDRVLRKRLVHHFGAHTRAVLEVPFEPHFVDGGSLEWAKLSKETREAWMNATATVADGL